MHWSIIQHDYKGRSSAPGALALWVCRCPRCLLSFFNLSSQTHNMKNASVLNPTIYLSSKNNLYHLIADVLWGKLHGWRMLRIPSSRHYRSMVLVLYFDWQPFWFSLHMQAGVQFRDIYAFAEENNFTFVGGVWYPFLAKWKIDRSLPAGSDPGVGAAGGWVQVRTYPEWYYDRCLIVVNTCTGRRPRCTFQYLGIGRW